MLAYAKDVFKRLACLLQGVKNAVPKTILQLMNVEGMTRENVASRLQKYRQSLKKLEAASISPPVTTSSAELQRMQESRNQYEAHQQTMAGLASCVVRPGEAFWS